MIKAWSFSRYSTYSECPRKAKYKFIDKLQEPSSSVLERGTALHQLCEYYLRGIKKTIPQDIKLISAELRQLKKLGAIPEAQFTFKRDWSTTQWNDWGGAWVRIQADSIVPPIADDEVPTVLIDDFKSGGKIDTKTDEMVYKDEYPLQLELYCVAGLLSYPTAQKAKARLIFIDHGKTVESVEYDRKQLPKLQKQWEMRTKKMLNDTKFKPTPGNACRWCHFRKSNAGPCEF